ncbi:MAG: ion transporter, partial [Gammaproteobacteria bacterium]|nr:ion transporter [Gammaproteobacteria bacterium]
MDKLTSQCQELYYGLTPRAVRARSLMLAVDVIIIAYFVLTTFMPLYDW